jgi:thiamine pyrophosphate-dependent acetolactate synthase large subunit-like protein
MGILEAPAPGAAPVMQGLKCPECGSHALIRKDGCDCMYSEVDISVAPDFVKLAEAYGATGFRAQRPDELHSVLKAGLSHEGVVVIDIVVSKEENVFPMVPAGASACDMIVR